MKKIFYHMRKIIFIEIFTHFSRYDSLEKVTMHGIAQQALKYMRIAILIVDFH